MKMSLKNKRFVIASLIIYLFYGSPAPTFAVSPTGTASKFLALLRAHNYEKIAKLQTTQAPQRLDAEDWRSFWNQFEYQNGTIRKWNLQGEIQRNSPNREVIVKYNVVTSKPEKWIFTFCLFPEKGSWHINTVLFQRYKNWQKRRKNDP
jgi:hypothetical protein